LGHWVLTEGQVFAMTFEKTLKIQKNVLNPKRGKRGGRWEVGHKVRMKIFWEKKKKKCAGRGDWAPKGHARRRGWESENVKLRKKHNLGGRSKRI